MPATEPGKIRNIAVVGHRGVGKTSLAEAMLFQAGKINRLGTIELGTTGFHPCGKFDPLGSHPTDPRAKYRSYYPADVLPA